MNESSNLCPVKVLKSNKLVIMGVHPNNQVIFGKCTKMKKFVCTAIYNKNTNSKQKPNYQDKLVDCSLRVNKSSFIKTYTTWPHHIPFSTLSLVWDFGAQYTKHFQHRNSYQSGPGIALTERDTSGSFAGAMDGEGDP